MTARSEQASVRDKNSAPTMTYKPLFAALYEAFLALTHYFFWLRRVYGTLANKLLPVNNNYYLLFTRISQGEVFTGYKPSNLVSQQISIDELTFFAG